MGAGRRLGKAFGAVVLTALVCGCAAGGRPTATVGQGEYVNREQGFGFRIPAGFQAVESRNPFSTPEYVVRYEAPEGDAALTARSEAVGAVSCIDAAKRVLRERAQADVLAEQPFTVSAAGGLELPAWRADMRATDREGKIAVYCDGGRVVVLEGSATAAAFPRHRDALESAIRSFAYVSGSTVARIEPRAVPTPEPYVEHVVRWRGQTLGSIAKWYTGAFDNWKKLTALNPELTVGNAALRVGRIVRIPQSLVTNAKPMPRPRSVAPPASRQAAPKAAGEAPPAEEPAEEAPAPEEELPPVIGPK